MIRVFCAVLLACIAGATHTSAAGLFYSVETRDDGKHQYDFTLSGNDGSINWIQIGVVPWQSDALFPEGADFFTSIPDGSVSTYSWSNSGEGPTLCLAGSCGRGFYSMQNSGWVRFSGVSEAFAAQGDLKWQALQGTNPTVGQLQVARMVPGGNLPVETLTPVPLPAPIMLLGAGLVLLGAMRRRSPSISAS